MLISRVSQDNLLFSCCCARVDFSWSTVCDCYAGGYKCEKTCLENAVIGESVYTTVGTVSNLVPFCLLVSILIYYW
jgi:putative lipase involved disintegration of autophagic bodies